jgi:hypothetical protein
MRTKYFDREAHPLEKLIDQLAITRADLHAIAGRRAVIDCLSTPATPLAPKLAEWLESVGVNLERFNVQIERYWSRMKHRNEAL